MNRLVIMLPFDVLMQVRMHVQPAAARAAVS